MAVFTNNTPASDYGCILNVGVTNGQVGLTNVLQQIQDGYGNPTPVLISTIAVDFLRSGYTFQLDGVSITAQGADINSMCQPNPVALGNQSLTPPIGTTAERPSVPTEGEFRFNSDTDEFEGYNGSAWVTFSTPGSTVTSVTGTSNRITVSPTTGDVVVNISPFYVGQSTITTLGTIVAGTWQATVIAPTYGGTGINNGSNTLTLAGSLTTIGPYLVTFNFTSNTDVTFPTSGTLATTATANVISVTGDSSTILATPTTGNVVVSILSTYVGQTSITTLGTIGTGVWEGTDITVTYGGTGASSFTEYAVLCAGTTSTGAFQSVATGTPGYVLTYVSDSALPIWQEIGEPSWQFQNTSPETLVPNSAYIANDASLLTFDMPSTVPALSVFEIQGFGAGGWIIQFSPTQTCYDDTVNTSEGGTLASNSSVNCSVKIICTVANTTFVVNNSNGTLAFA